MADAEVAQVKAPQPAGTEPGPSSRTVWQTVPDQPPAISNKLGLDEAYLHRRSLLMALVLLKENRRYLVNDLFNRTVIGRTLQAAWWEVPDLKCTAAPHAHLHMHGPGDVYVMHAPMIE